MTAYIVASNFGYWGRGPNPKEALLQCLKAGGRKLDSGVIMQFMEVKGVSDVALVGIMVEYPQDAFRCEDVRLNRIGALI